MSENIIIDSVTIISPNNSPNTDGINPESSKNIFIKNSVISVGDDCVALKSGRNNDGRARNLASENIYIKKISRIFNNAAWRWICSRSLKNKFNYR